MSNENNVINLENAIHTKIKASIRAVFNDRGGNPVAEPFLIDQAVRIADDLTLALTLITEMVTDGILEKIYMSGSDAKHRAYRLPMYRLAFTGW